MEIQNGKESVLKKRYIFATPVDVLTEREVLEKIVTFLNSSGQHYIITLNSLMLEESFKDEELSYIIKNADLVIPDSIGIVLAIRLFYGISIARVSGVDILYKLFPILEKFNKSVYLLGSKKEIVKKTVENIKRMFPKVNIAGFHNGYYPISEEEKVVSEISKLSPDVLLVCLGMGRQEKFINKYKNKINAKLYMGLGGSFDIISGYLPRAPTFLRRLSLEWLFRIYIEPRRIVGVIRLFRFILRLLFGHRRV